MSENCSATIAFVWKRPEVNGWIKAEGLNHVRGLPGLHATNHSTVSCESSDNGRDNASGGEIASDLAYICWSLLRMKLDRFVPYFHLIHYVDSRSLDRETRSPDVVDCCDTRWENISALLTFSGLAHAWLVFWVTDVVVVTLPISLAPDSPILSNTASRYSDSWFDDLFICIWTISVCDVLHVCTLARLMETSVICVFIFHVRFIQSLFETFVFWV